MTRPDGSARNTLLVAPWDATDDGAAAMSPPAAAAPEETRVLLVTFRRPAAACSRRWRETVGDPDELVAVAAGVPEGPDTVEREGETLVSEGSSDPTWAGIHANEWLSRWDEADDDAPVVVHAEGLEVLVGRTGAETAFRFLHLLVSRVRRIDAVGRYLLDPAECSETTVRTLAHACDEVRRYAAATGTWE